MDTILWVLVFCLLMGGLGWMRYRESKFLKKKTKDAIRPSLRKEWEHEREDAARRKKAFEDSLKKFGPHEDDKPV